MKIEHIAMYVNDLEASRNFFMKYFGAGSNEMYHNRVTGFSSCFLTFDSGARLEIMSKPGVNNAREKADCIGLAHIALSLGSAEKVDSLTALLKADGYEVISGPRTTGDGYYESCISDAEGNRIELTI